MLVLQGDRDSATCVAAIDASHFACGTQGGRIAIWDQRQQSSPAQTLSYSGGLSSSLGQGCARGASRCLSSVAVQEDLILGGSLGGTVALWDRRYASVQLFLLRFEIGSAGSGRYSGPLGPAVRSYCPCQPFKFGLRCNIVHGSRGRPGHGRVLGRYSGPVEQAYVFVALKKRT